ncbi:hypothetical protein, partial [Microbacterium sp. GXS0129]|uniref:hypothetical protein n=1 Tax=Microbacterium sp. GXS0129 TaxID=3377836 RepID=UPI00383BBBA5
RRPGMDRGDGRDYKGNFTSRDPDAPPRDYEQAEKNGLDRVEEDLGGIEVIRDKVNVQYDGSPQKGGRYYDGYYPNGDGTFTGIEVKSGGAWNRYHNSEVDTQRAFDAGVSPANPAVGVHNDDLIRITRVILVQVD